MAKKKKNKEQNFGDILQQHFKEGAKVQKLINKIGKLVMAHDHQHKNSDSVICYGTRLHVLAAMINQLGIWETWQKLPWPHKYQVVTQFIDALDGGVKLPSPAPGQPPSGAGLEWGN